MREELQIDILKTEESFFGFEIGRQQRKHTFLSFDCSAVETFEPVMVEILQLYGLLREVTSDYQGIRSDDSYSTLFQQLFSLEISP